MCNTPTDKQRFTADQWGWMWSEQSCWRWMNQQEMKLQTGLIPPGRELDSPSQLKPMFNANHCSPVTQHTKEKLSNPVNTDCFYEDRFIQKLMTTWYIPFMHELLNPNVITIFNFVFTFEQVKNYAYKLFSKYI